jgi:hypothetical protein
VACGLGAVGMLREHGALRDDAEQRQAVDALQVAGLADATIEALEQEREAQAEQQAQHGAEDRVARDLGGAGRCGDGGGLGEFDVAGPQLGEDRQRLGAVLQGQALGRDALLGGERGELLLDERLGEGEVVVVGGQLV